LLSNIDFTQVFVVKKTKSYFFSAWSFFFRWPTSPKHEFLPTGILLGPLLQAAVFAALFFALEALSFQPLYSRLGTFIFLCVLTGCFHEDGLADSFDSLGVPLLNDGEEFRAKAVAAMKDPRLGSFGISALIVLWLLRGLVAFEGVPIFWILSVILLSRASSLYFGKVALGRLGGLGSAKGSFLLKEVSQRGSQFFWVLALVAAFVGFGKQLSLWTAVGLVVSMVGFSAFFIWALARRLGGVNGDIMGGAACFSEAAVFFIILGAGF
jgi:adenosylcobinamide-GDP ribazoletransferase